MGESQGMKSLYALMGFCLYAFVLLEVAFYVGVLKGVLPSYLSGVLMRFSGTPFFSNVLWAKLYTLGGAVIVAVGARPRKDMDFRFARHVLLPCFLGLLLAGLSLFFFAWGRSSASLVTADAVYGALSLLAIPIWEAGLSNIAKMVSAGFLKDKFNVENETFDQPRKPIENPYSVNIPMLFYFKRRINKGWINIANPFRGTMVFGIPGSGKSFGVILPFVKQHLAKKFTMVLYDFKYPDLGQVAYYHFEKAKKLEKDTMIASLFFLLSKRTFGINHG